MMMMTENGPSVDLRHEMPVDGVTERDGRWYLRHAILPSGDQVWLSSARAPAGTRATDLRPESIEVVPHDDWYEADDPLVLPVELLRALTAWPPDAR